MTDKERKLLYDFLDGVDTTSQAKSNYNDANKKTDLDALSRSMRQA
jgi:hypothetical protein